MEDINKTIEERLDILERKQKIYEDMLNHLNNVMRDNLIQKIEQVTREMVSENNGDSAKNNEGL